MSDQEIYQKEDGTFTVILSPWCEEPINGIPSLEIAETICRVAHAAMRDYSETMSSEY